MEKLKKVQFILTGSSARKLKHGGANLLGGRAFSMHLFPLTSLELPPSTTLRELLAWGSLPMLFEQTNVEEKIRFLKTYTQTYLKQEIQLEQLVRNVTSFREFLDLAAQSNGEVVNYSNIATASGVDEKTVARYFEILVDTLIGYNLEPFDESIRVRQRQKPKFYLFDTGVQRFLSQTIDVPLKEGSTDYGKLFEQFIVCECIRLNEYFERNFKFFYLRTKDDAEIDLIVRKPGRKTLLIEIKSSACIEDRHMAHLRSLGAAIRHEEKWVISNESTARRTEDNVFILPWRTALERLFVL